MRRLAALTALLVLAACSGGTAATPSPTPMAGAIPDAVDEAFCDLELALPGATVAIGPLAEQLGGGNFDPEVIRREGPTVRRAIASVRPFLPTIARWAPSNELATVLDAGLAGVDDALRRLERDPNDLIARLDLATSGHDVDRAIRHVLPALQAEHPEIRCSEAG